MPKPKPVPASAAATVLTYEEILNAAPAVSKLSQMDLYLPIVLRLLKMSKAVSGEVKFFREAQMQALTAKAEKDADGKPIVEKDQHGERYKMSSEDGKALTVEMDALLKQTVDFPFAPLTVADFPPSFTSEAKVNAATLLALGPLFLLE